MGAPTIIHVSLQNFSCDLKVHVCGFFSHFQVVAEAAEDIWDRYGFDFGTDYSGLYVALSHANYNVRLAAAEALAAALDENPDTIQVNISFLETVACSLFV